MQGDAASLHRLAVILLDNAIKYAGTGGAVTLRLAAAGSQAVLTVHNTGTPIPPDRLPHILSAFTAWTHPTPATEPGWGW